MAVLGMRRGKMYGVTYRCKNLSEIAHHFRKMGESVQEAQMKAKTIREGVRLAGEASAWFAAARTLDNTVLEEV